MLEREFQGWTEDADGGVAHHDVHAAELLAKRREGLGHAFRIADIGWYQQCSPAQSADRSADGFGLVMAAAVNDGYLATRASELQRDGSANATGPACDQRYLS